MDVIEHGGRPLSRGRRILIGLIVLGAIAAIGYARARPRPSEPAAPPRPSVDAALVETGTGITWQTTDATKDFVVQVDLVNFNGSPVRVRAAPIGPEPGFVRLTAAVGYGDRAAAAGAPITLGAQQRASLTVSGRVACGTAPVGAGRVTVLVDGEPTELTLPEGSDGDWVHTVRKLLCATN